MAAGAAKASAMEAPAAETAAGTVGFRGPEIPPQEVYDRCVRCGLCLPSCPTYLETLVETSSPRGRIALIKGVAEGALDLTGAGFVHQMFECLDCRACEAACPSGVQYGRLLEPARAQVERAVAVKRGLGKRLGREFLLGDLFAHPWLMRMVAALLRFYQRSGLQRLVRSSGVLRAFGLVDAERMLPAISPKFFIPRDQHWRATTLERKATAFMHAGCIMQVAFAEVDEATVRVLQRSGCDVVAPSGQRCCGAIAVHAGEPARARALAVQNIEAFEESGAEVYVVNAAGCGSALKEYHLLFAEDPEWAERARAFSARVRDVTEFLDDIGISEELGPIDAVVTYQEPCHLVHAQRIAEAPRRLLRKIPGLQLREMEESALCCGSAGIYNLTQPEMAQRLAKRKAANVIAAEPNVVATANPGCALQVAAALRDTGHALPVKHIVELLDDSYAAYNPSRGSLSFKASSKVE
jgi:glycolate oxidase iron-sulfur subunit